MARRTNKKGTIADVIIVMVIITVMAVGVLIVYKISNSLNTKFQASPQLEAQGQKAFGQINGMYSGVIDNTFLFLVIGLCVGALILAFMVRVHPVFFVGYLLVLIIVIFLSGVMANIYLNLANNANLIDEATNLKFITHIIGKLPLIIGILGFLIAIVMYKTWSSEQG